MSWKKENKTSRNLSRNQFIIMLPYQNIKQKPCKCLMQFSINIAHSHCSKIAMAVFMLETLKTCLKTTFMCIINS